MSLTTLDKQDIRTIADDAIKDGIAHLPTEDTVRQMIKDGIETSPIILRMDTRLNKLETGMKASFYRLEVLNEDTRHKVDAVLEAISVYSGVGAKVTNHDLRLEDIESKQPMIIKTLALHSKQLKSQV